MAKCKFKPGQSWITRAGLVATIESIDSPCNGVYPVNVKHQNRESISSHTKTGLFFEGTESNFDLIEKVKPLKIKVGCQYLTASGETVRVDRVDAGDDFQPYHTSKGWHTKTGQYFSSWETGADGQKVGILEDKSLQLVSRVKFEKPEKCGSNTKISKEQKQIVKDAIDIVFHVYPDCGVVAAVRPVFKGSKMVHFAVSYASHDEQKFRPNVGKYYALCRLNELECLTIPADTVEHYLVAIDTYGK